MRILILGRATSCALPVCDSGLNCASPSHPKSCFTEKERGFSMVDAQCVCGALRLMMREPTKIVAACHCLACQRRTGTSFSVNAFYATDPVEVSGTAREFIRVADSGRNVRMYFCPTCGSTVYWKPDAQPTMIGVAVGALADPNFPAPTLSIFERTKHHWVTLVEGVERFQASPIQEYASDI